MKENKIGKEIIEKFIKAAQQVVEHGLVSCGSGNLSYRINAEQFIITTSGAWMSELSENDIALCNLSDGTCLNNKQPSIEIEFHRAILEKRKDVTVVLHCQSPYATTLACSKYPKRNFNVIPEIPYYIGEIAVVQYADPGSEELAGLVSDAMGNHDLVLIQNHGQVTIGRTFQEAIQRAAFFELACKIIIYTGDAFQTLSEKEVASLYNARKGNKQQPNAIS